MNTVENGTACGGKLGPKLEALALELIQTEIGDMNGEAKEQVTILASKQFEEN